jgi:hypothetical protein
MDAANPTTSENAGTSPEGERSAEAGAQEGSRGKAANDATRVTPMMEQYIEIKAANPDCLLFYRMGDFYEMFFQDAEVASRALGIVLNKRGKHLGHDIPMCGVPIERADEYLHRLIALGIASPYANNSRTGRRASAVPRAWCAAMSCAGNAWTLTEDSLLEARSNNYLLALARARVSSDEDRFALAWIDISTGDSASQIRAASVAAEIARIEPGRSSCRTRSTRSRIRPYLRSLPAVTLTRDIFDGATAERRWHRSSACRRPRRSAHSRASRPRRRPPRSPTSSGHKSGSARHCRRRSARWPVRRSRSIRRRAAILSSSARSAASGAARSLPPLTAP